MASIDDGDALNLSTGIYTSFKQFAAMAAHLVGYDPEVVGQSNQPAGVFARGGDTTKQKAHGFEYTTSFEDGVRKMLAFLEPA
jgi:nucleoside-diphosphate-sugar epimerase